MKKFSLALLVIIAIAIAIVWSVDSKTYGSFAASRIISEARNAGLTISLEQPRLNLSSFSCSDLGIVLPNPPVFFHSQDTACLINPLRLLVGPDVSCSGNLYRGTFVGSFSGAWPGSDGKISATFSKIDLKEHPQLLGFGIQSGTLNSNLRDGKISKGRLTAGAFDLQLTDFSKPEPTMLSSIIKTLPHGLALPSIQGLALTFKGELSDNHLTISQGDATLQLGSIHVTGEVDLNDRNQISQLRLSSEIRLTEEGSKVIGPLLILLDTPSVTTETRNFRVTINGPPNSPAIVATRI